MSSVPCVFFSNRVEVLFQQLKAALFFTGSQPLTRRIVIVPSPAMKSWLLFQMARDPSLGIAAGMEIGFIDEKIEALSALISPASLTQEPQELELCLALEKEILGIIQAYPNMPAKEQNLWRPLLAYLNIEPIESLIFTEKSTKRILTLAATLGRLFIHYGRFGERLIENWRQDKFLGGWQEQLWRRLEIFFHPWNYPSRKLLSLQWDPFPDLGDIQVHLFGLSYLAPLHHRLLMKLGKYIPLNYYLMSPCQKFWSDILSDKEGVKLKSYWQDKGAGQAQQLALEDYLRDNNPLLANFGRLGREMALQMETSQAVSFEQYALPASITEFSSYQQLLDSELLLTSSPTPLSLLEAVQTDIALLRNPEGSCNPEFNEYDGTIQVHAAPKRMREVQAIYDALMAIFDKHKQDDEPVTPGDVVVMAPDMGEYAPFINSIFGTSECTIDHQVMDVHMPAQNRFIQAFLHLLKLPFTRWDSISLLRLFDYDSFMRCHRLTAEDVGILRNWIKSAGIRWGKDHVHRNELLKRDHCQREMCEESWAGTWEHGLGRLLEGLAMISHERRAGTATEYFAPLDCVDAAQGELLGKLVFLLRSLIEDLKPLHDNSMLTLADWSKYLRCLCEAYFSTGINEDDLEGYRTLMRHIDMFGRAANRFGSEVFAFDSIRRQLERTLQNRTSDHRETHLNAIRFCSLLPMRAVPAKVLVLIGMQDGAFPRTEEHFSFNLLLHSPQADYYPSQIDFDRYLFLESLLSARKYFLMSYIAQAPGDPREQPPSLLITELLVYLDKAYKLPAKKVSDACHFRHSTLPFDKDYFSPNAVFKSYSNSHYAAAKAYYCSEKKSQHNFLPAFASYFPGGPDKFDEIIVDLSDLAAFAKNPLKTYFNKTLGIYLEKEEDRTVKCNEELELSPLDAAILSREGLFVPAEKLLERAEMIGRLPRGPFRKISTEKIMHDLDKLQANLHRHGVMAGQIFPMEFSGSHLKPHFSGSMWKVPALDIETPRGRKIKVIGKFEAVSAQGLIVFIGDGLEESIKVWPLALVFSCLVKEYTLSLFQKVIFAKGAKAQSKQTDFDDPQKSLGQYLDYYLTAKTSASPLLPAWTPSIMSGDIEELQKKYPKGTDDRFQQVHDEYLKWLGSTCAETDLASAVERWQIPAQELFAGLTAAWYPKMMQKGQSEGANEVL